MFNIDTTVSALIAAEKVNNCRNLTDTEKLTLLDAVTASLMIDAPGCPDHAKVVAASIERMTRNERANIAAASTRQTEVSHGTPTGIEDETGVATEGTEEAPEEASRKAAGIEEPSQDAGSPADTARGPKASKASRTSKA